MQHRSPFCFLVSTETSSFPQFCFQTKCYWYSVESTQSRAWQAPIGSSVESVALICWSWSGCVRWRPSAQHPEGESIFCLLNEPALAERLPSPTLGLPNSMWLKSDVGRFDSHVSPGDMSSYRGHFTTVTEKRQRSRIFLSLARCRTFHVSISAENNSKPTMLNHEKMTVENLGRAKWEGGE